MVDFEPRKPYFASGGIQSLESSQERQTALPQITSSQKMLKPPKFMIDPGFNSSEKVKETRDVYASRQRQVKKLRAPGRMYED